jgi:uncharacterized protein
MKIGVLSDTHLSSPDPMLDHILDELFSETDLILHAGDIVSHRVLDRLEERGVVAVCGNMDDYEVMDRVPQSRILSAAGKRIGLMHGWGAKEGLAQRIMMRFTHERLDLIVYGHSHMPFWGQVNGVPMFNPGAASRNRDTGTSTVGIIEIVEEKFQARFLTVST